MTNDFATAIATVVSMHPQKVEQIRERPSQIGWLVGQVMLLGSFGTYAFVESRLRSALGI